MIVETIQLNGMIGTRNFLVTTVGSMVISGLTARRRRSTMIKGSRTINQMSVKANSRLTLQGYTDADWQGDPDDRKSTSGYIFTLAGGAISWCSRKQDSLALSSMEAKYIATFKAVKEDVWLREFLASLNVMESASLPVTIFCDNQALIKVSKSRSLKIPNFILKVNTLRKGIIIFVMQ